MSVLLLAAFAVVSADPPALETKAVLLEVGGEPRKVTAAEGALRAVRAMEAEKFRFAEVGPDGVVRGYSDTLSALVVPFPLPDGQVLFRVFVAGWNHEETRQVRVRLVEAVLNGPAAGENAATTFGAPVPPLLRKAPRLAVYRQDRVGAPILRHFASAAAISLEKVGLNVTTSAPLQVSGVGAGMVGGVFVAPTANAQVVTIVCVTTSDRTAVAESGAKALVGGVIKILYE